VHLDLAGHPHPGDVGGGLGQVQDIVAGGGQPDVGGRVAGCRFADRIGAVAGEGKLGYVWPVRIA
jgi:hypothetical protein